MIKRLGLVAMLAFGIVAMLASAALAQASTAVTTVNTGMTAVFSDATDIVTGNSSKLFALLAITVGLSFGYKLIKRWVKP